MLVRIVMMALGAVVRVVFVLRLRVLVVPERHALTGDDRCHPLQRQEQHQRKGKRAENGSGHRWLLYVSRFEWRGAVRFPRTGHQSPPGAAFVKHSVMRAVIGVHHRVPLAARDQPPVHRKGGDRGHRK